jgi:xylulokinase
MLLLGLDVGSSSVKAGLLRGGRLIGNLVRASYPTHHQAQRVEVDPTNIIAAVKSAIAGLPAPKKIDAVAFSVMSPAFVLMDRRGKHLTPIITHQDRRAQDQAREIEKRVGFKRHLAIAGNRPFPGSITSTTLLWFKQNAPAVVKKTDLLGHLNTYLLRQFAGARAIDPANASFTGLYQTVTQKGWSDELIKAIGIRPSILPEIHDAADVAGTLTETAAASLGLRAGIPLYTGIIDTSSAVLLTHPRPGMLLNSSGSTDVLTLCTDKPRPHPDLLTRAMGSGKLWLSVATMAAAGSALNWARDQFFGDLDNNAFDRLLKKLITNTKTDPARGVVFDNYLAGVRAGMDQKTAAYTNLTLSTTREDMLAALIQSLAKASAARLPLLCAGQGKINRHVTLTGGLGSVLHNVLHRDWPGKWTFHTEPEAALRGLWELADR